MDRQSGMKMLMKCKDTAAISRFLESETQEECYEFLKQTYLTNIFGLQYKKTGAGPTAFHWLAADGQSDKICRMLDAVADKTRRYMLLKIDSRYNETPVHWAVNANQLEAVGCMLRSLTPELNYKLLKMQNSDGYTALHSASRSSNSMIKLLLHPEIVTTESKHKLLKIQSRGGNTVLHKVAEFQSEEVIKFLLSGFNPEQQYELLEIKNNKGDTAAGNAKRKNKIENAMCLQLIQQCTYLQRHDGPEANDNYDQEHFGILEQRVTELEVDNARKEARIKELENGHDEHSRQLNEISNMSHRIQDLQAEQKSTKRIFESMESNMGTIVQMLSTMQQNQQTLSADNLNMKSDLTEINEDVTVLQQRRGEKVDDQGDIVLSRTNPILDLNPHERVYI